MTYAEKRRKQDEAKEERWSAFKAQLRAISEHMKGFPRVEFPDERPWAFEGTFISGNGQHRFYVQAGHKDGGANVRGDYAHPGEYRRGDERPSIGFTYTRNPKTLAADIERRFLPDFYTYADELAERAAQTQAHENKKEALAERVERETGLKMTGSSMSDRKSLRLSNFDANVGADTEICSVQDETLKIEIRRVPADVGIKILNLLQEAAH